MANEQNLKKRCLSSEEASRMGKLGVEAKRAKIAQRKTAREFAEAALNAEVEDKKTGKKIVVKDAIIQKLVAKAIQENDLQTVKYLFELIGESSAQKLEVTGADGKDLIPHKPMTKAEINKLLKDLENE